jgi:hypothetical protein
MKKHPESSLFSYLYSVQRALSTVMYMSQLSEFIKKIASLDSKAWLGLVKFVRLEQIPTWYENCEESCLLCPYFAEVKYRYKTMNLLTCC